MYWQYQDSYGYLCAVADVRLVYWVVASRCLSLDINIIVVWERLTLGNRHALVVPYGPWYTVEATDDLAWPRPTCYAGEWIHLNSFRVGFVNEPRGPITHIRQAKGHCYGFRKRHKPLPRFLFHSCELKSKLPRTDWMNPTVRAIGLHGEALGVECYRALSEWVLEFNRKHLKGTVWVTPVSRWLNKSATAVRHILSSRFLHLVPGSS